MSGKQSKKMKQLARREYRAAMQAIAEQHSRLIKPKPRFMPMFLWLWMIGFFINIKR